MIDITSSVCPDRSLIKPCECYEIRRHENQLSCYGNEYIDLVKIFQTLENNLTKTGKHFKVFHLNNTFISELKENTFSDITFDEILIKSCAKLKSIHKNAFNTTDQVITILTIEDTPMLTSPDNSIFQSLSKFVRAEYITLSLTNITEIPSNAFQTIEGKQDHLDGLIFIGSSFRKLGNNAFSQFNNLSILQFLDTSIDFIPENAFQFNDDSEKPLTIIFQRNSKLNCSVKFSKNSLIKFKRPTTIFFRSFSTKNYISCKMKYLEQKIFLPFLRSNKENQISLHDDSIDLRIKKEPQLNCSDCRNNWLLSNSELLKRVEEFPSCTQRRKFADPVNFINCPDEISKNNGMINYQENGCGLFTMITLSIIRIYSYNSVKI